MQENVFCLFDQSIPWRSTWQKFFQNLGTKKGLFMINFQNGRQMRQFVPICYTNYCFSVAFYCDKLEYDNILQV